MAPRLLSRWDVLHSRRKSSIRTVLSSGSAHVETRARQAGSGRVDSHKPGAGSGPKNAVRRTKSSGGTRMRGPIPNFRAKTLEAMTSSLLGEPSSGTVPPALLILGGVSSGGTQTDATEKGLCCERRVSGARVRVMSSPRSAPESGSGRPAAKWTVGSSALRIASRAGQCRARHLPTTRNRKPHSAFGTCNPWLVSAASRTHHDEEQARTAWRICRLQESLVLRHRHYWLTHCRRSSIDFGRTGFRASASPPT